MVMPATFASGMRAAMSGGGDGGGTVTHNFNISAWDGASVQSWLTRGGAQQMARAMASYNVLNPAAA